MGNILLNNSAKGVYFITCQEVAPNKEVNTLTPVECNTWTISYPCILSILHHSMRGITALVFLMFIPILWEAFKLRRNFQKFFKKKQIIFYLLILVNLSPTTLPFIAYPRDRLSRCGFHCKGLVYKFPRSSMQIRAVYLHPIHSKSKSEDSQQRGPCFYMVNIYWMAL